MSFEMSEITLRESIEWFKNKLKILQKIDADPEYIRLYEKEVNRLKHQLKNKS